MATRRYTGNLSRQISPEDLERRTALAADPWKVDSELQEIFSNIAIGDPAQSGSNGNLLGSHVVVQTPATANQEFAVKHGLTVPPRGVLSMCPLVAGGGQVRVRMSRSPDSVYAYLKCPDAVDTNVVTVLYFFIT